MILLLLLLLLFPLYLNISNLISKEQFTVLENTPYKPIDFKQFNTLTTNIKFDYPPFIPGTHKNIIQESKNPHLDQATFISNYFISQLNDQKINSWKLLELLNFSEKIIDENISSFVVELILLESKTIPFHLSFVASLDIRSGKIIFSEITIYNKKSIFKNAYNPNFKGYFEIKNLIGLLTPFKTSETRLITPDDLKKTKTKKISKPYLS